MKTGATFDFHEIKKHLESESYETDRDYPHQETRRIWLGTIFGITPSGKFYVPFACSNVAGDCPVCDGMGTRKEAKTGRRLRKRAARRERDFATGTIARHGHHWPNPGFHRYMARVNDYRRHAQRTIDMSCTACGGIGSISAARDARWTAKLERDAEAIGAFVDYHDDSIFIAQSREAYTDDVGDDVDDTQPFYGHVGEDFCRGT